ncbi:MAG: phage protease, partial [Chthoniobacteraceae bacterium]
MNLTPIANHTPAGKFQLPKDGWYHLIPSGEYPGLLEDASGKRTRVIQVCDTASLNAIVNRFTLEASQPNFGGVLIDQEHFSYDPGKSTEAFGWIKELQHRGIDADRHAPGTGVWARIEWTDTGAPAVSTGRYRFISPVWQPKDCEMLPGNRLRPLRLDTAGLTNKPNMRGMVPLSNRKPSQQDAASTQAKIESIAEPLMNQIATKLGLSADASEEAILGELARILNRAADAETRLRPLADENASLKNRIDSLESEQIDADLDAHGIREENVRGKLRPVLIPMKNRADRVDFLKLVNRSGGRANQPLPTLTNRQ